MSIIDEMNLKIDCDGTPECDCINCFKVYDDTYGYGFEC